MLTIALTPTEILHYIPQQKPFRFIDQIIYINEYINQFLNMGIIDNNNIIEVCSIC